MTDGDIIAKLEETTKDATRRQQDTLRAILERNAGVRYLQPHLRGYPAPPDAATFRRAVPLSCYDDYADHVFRMADGDDDDGQPFLSVDSLVCFFYSSGTSSMKPKMIPYFDSVPSKAISFLAHQGSAAILRRLFPPRPSVDKFLWFMYAGNVMETKGGYKAMAASAFPFQSDKSNPSHFLSMSVSPKGVILGLDVQQQMYCHLLCGLRQFNLVDGIRAPYAAGLIRAIYLLESKWKQLCEDLECGYPSLGISDDSMRDSVIEVLCGPQPELAKQFQSICEEENWKGILTKIWPNARYVKCVTTGSMVQYYSKIKYYAGEIPVLGGDYFASECCVGINLDILQPPELTRFTLLPTAAYFEFLPFNMNKMSVSNEETVDVSGVEMGKMYEMVVTTYRGLYRYRLGDIVKVVGFYNSSPQVEFVTRAPNHPGEVITEGNLISAIKSFQQVLRSEATTEITEFTCFLDMALNPKQLKVFVEVREARIFLQEENLQESVLVLRRCCSSLEDDFGDIYKLMKARGEVGPMLLYIVKPGSFDKVLQVAIENGAPASQYKPPKIIRNHKVVDLLEVSAVVVVKI
ncbi:LOW QUALITY PROTEIN: probable indole-3-acetic acid-amido synthetase GH3.6 [Actinidia eriantha]|uniref:LOW QUALITY PROTEIN: probable indole-3-acetic acid-amido synthetase GH3.6 n=1 Tax=Actinidia eriantha TaxID=165200 RepID=UPI00258D1AC2|nr:LOW QUALITY PROTEIN: probable indole-3-acetic acid-amido synthetase GH3.6 [Actinidia eriantha]